ncbi:ribonuclease H-like domain-containing protein [Tanacetum coccineum]
MKARSTLMTGIPNEHQLKFKSIKDAKKLLEAIEKRFGGNEATKKTQRNLLKQQYKNFTDPNSEMLDQNFDRLQKLVSQLDLLGEKLLQEDVNQKLLRSLSPEWNTHVVVWRNKVELDTMSMDDLYNNLKVYEPEVKGMSSSSSSTQNMAFVSSSNNNTSSSNEIVNTAHGVTTASTQSKVECYNCHKRGHFARECKAPRNQDNKNKESSRRSVHVETTTSTALVSCDGLGGYDWSDQAKEGPNYALMAYSSSSSDSEVSNDSTCSKSCLETVKLLKSQYDQLLKDFKKSELMVLGYKTGLQSVEEKLEFYKKNEYVYVEKINGLKWDIQVGEITIGKLRKKLEIVQKEKDGIQFNVDKFENASKSLNKIIECQIVDNCKKGLGYNAVPPPYTGNFMPPTLDLSFTGLDEFVNKHVVEKSKAKSSDEEPKEVGKNDDAPIFEEWVSDSEEENVSQTKTKKKIVKPGIAKKEFVKPKQQEKTARKTIKQVETHRQNTHGPRGNQRNWNNMMIKEQQTWSDVDGCFINSSSLCGGHKISYRWIKYCYASKFVLLKVQAGWDHESACAIKAQKKVQCCFSALKLILLGSHKDSNNRSEDHSCFYSYVPIGYMTKRGRNINRLQLGRSLVRHETKEIYLRRENLEIYIQGGNPQMDLQDQGLIDSGCSRHMTRNMSYLTDYEEIDEGYVAFGGNPKGGKITRKCTIKTVKGNLVRGLPSKLFENDQTCVACQKGKQHRASCKSKTENSISLPLHLLHMDLFGPTFVKSLMKKMYCLVTDDYSIFTWVFFLATKNETSGILKSFITRIENLVDHKVKVIRCDNGTEFKNREMNQFCEIKGILRQFSVARTPQQRRVVERRNRTLIEAARTMLADSNATTFGIKQ